MENTEIINSSPAKNIPLEVLIDYSNKGLTYKDIGKLVGCTDSNVSQRFMRAGFTPEHLKSYKDNRADIFAWWQSKILNSVSEDDIKKAPLHSKILATGILFDKERLERGQATSISGFEGLADDGLMAKMSGLLERAGRIGIKITEIVGQLPSDLRDQVLQSPAKSLDGSGIIS